MFMELLVMECKRVAQIKKISSCRLGPRACLRALEALGFYMQKYRFSLFLGTFNVNFEMSYFIQVKYLVFSCVHKEGITRFVPLKPPAKVLNMHGQEIK